MNEPLMGRFTICSLSGYTPSCPLLEQRTTSSDFSSIVVISVYVCWFLLPSFASFSASIDLHFKHTLGG